MTQLTRQDLLSLEQYAEQRAAFRQRLFAHKRRRRVALGAHAALHFEDRLSVQYQIQEMLRIERIFEVDGIQQELDTYNPLIPDGHNFKATLMLEYTEPAQRRRALAALLGVEERVWLEVAGQPKVWAIADEDMPRSDAEKTSAVHFLRFELSVEMRRSLRHTGALAMGVDHPAYTERVTVSADTVAALLEDLAL